jgi:hypothetical protein
MERRMESVNVSVNEQGMVQIEQENPVDPEGGACITLHPSQIDLVCEWLREASKEALTYKPGAPAR